MEIIEPSFILTEAANIIIAEEELCVCPIRFLIKSKYRNSPPTPNCHVL